VPLSTEAKAVWIDFFNEHNAAMESTHGKLAAACSKLEAYAARFALVLAMVRLVTAETWAISTDMMIDVESMRAGAELARWFRYEAERVYAILEESDTETFRRQILELIRRHGGQITPNDLRRRSRGFATSEEAEEFLDGLVREELGKWENVAPGNAGGRPTRVFRMLEAVSVSETREFPEEDEV
jgi:hypothetical protein